MNTENNKLIAEFLGYNTKSHWWNNGDGGFLQDTDCKFHSSWDWLMPVVEKIETTVSETNIYFNGNHSCIIEMGLDVQIRAFGDSKMEATYTAVVEFITWYNKQQPQK